ncbi:aspartyl protease family protein At5g10770-like [Telopea speciosissima]|uniref:aspartyl protease family protein At5g10770-like n=1 Tax=Telopea speciosissima TaxID=54955 RepID=UPI001CC3D35F|nr:aspartyl protease family protein At5g10770-like [Telopea speciosissima]
MSLLLILFLFLLSFLVSSSHSIHHSLDDDHFSLPVVKIPVLYVEEEGAPYFLLKLGFGTPRIRYFHLLMDTGSSFTWVQCKPCQVRCFKQPSPIFDPSLSCSYAPIPCHSLECSVLKSATSFPTLPCSDTCKYNQRYLNNDVASIGDFAREMLHLLPNIVVPGFIFGCGQNNTGSPDVFDGVVGLGRNRLSLVDQSSPIYGKVFSFCLPSPQKSNGFLTIGNKGGLPELLTDPEFNYTSLVSLESDPDLYYINLVGISLGDDQTVSIPPFPLAIDTGSTVSLLPTSVYVPLRSAVRKVLSKYSPFPIEPLDTCYNLSSSVIPPAITLNFEGGIVIRLPQSRILLTISPFTCLPFIEIGDDDRNDGIIGGIQLQTLQVLIDVVNRKVGFAEKNCD